MKFSKYFFTLVFLVLFSSGVQAQVDHLLISEVLYNPSLVSDSLGEWVELYNPLATSIDLSSYLLEDNIASFSLSGIILPDSYFMIGKDNTSFSGLYGFDLDIAGMVLALGNSGDELSLFNGAAEIDYVSWAGGLNGRSLARQSLVVDTNASSDWISSVPTPTESFKDPEVPEPATLFLLLSGLFGLRFFKKK